MKIRHLASPFLLGVFFLMSVVQVNALIVDEMDMVSTDNVGTAGGGYSLTADISENNDYVVFDSGSTNLELAVDSDSYFDIFLKDISEGTIVELSVTAAEAESNGDSFGPKISDDGRYTVYYSASTNLVTGDTNGVNDILIYDSSAGTTTLLSRATGAAGTIGNAASTEPNISDDGRYIVYSSSATNLVAADTNAKTDIFMRDNSTNTTTRLSASSSGTQGNGDSSDPCVSVNAGYIVFVSEASNLVSGDTNGTADIFLKKPSGSISRISVSSSGAEANGESETPDVSDDGSYVVYASASSNLITGGPSSSNIYLRNSSTGSTTLVSRASYGGAVGDGLSHTPSISEDGRYITYSSSSTNLVEGDTNGVEDIFVYDTLYQETSRVSLGENVVQTEALSYFPTISDDGTRVLFRSQDENLTGWTTGSGQTQIFMASLEAFMPNFEVIALSYDETTELLTFTLENTGNEFPTEEVFSSIVVTNPDGTETEYAHGSSDDNNDFYEPGELATYDVSLILEEGDSNVEVCVDSEERTEESNELDNCTDIDVTIAVVEEEDDDPIQDDPIEDDPIQDDPIEDDPVEDDPIEDDPVEDDPVDDDEPEEEDTPLADDADDELTCENPFTDTLGHWGEKTICLLFMEGTVSGKSEGIFDPDGEVTRAEILKMILLNSGEDIPLSFEESAFPDVNEEDWFYGYVMHGFDLGVVEGYDDGTFRPNELVNRAEALTMILRMSEADEETSTSGLDFTDLLADDWFYDEVGLGVDYGLVEGYDDGTFHPGASITRAEASTIVRRAWYVWYQ